MELNQVLGSKCQEKKDNNIKKIFIKNKIKIETINLN
jgi:hypothetical protein